MASEAEMLANCREGDASAWDELFDLYYGATCRFIFQLGHDLSHEDAEEICQEVFLSVIKNIHSFQGQSQFQTWVFRIATNKARDFRDRRQAAKRGGGQTPVSLDAENPENGLKIDPPAPLPGPDLTLIQHEQLDRVRVALDQLDDPCREIIELRYFGDLNYEEISISLDLNPKTVSSRLSKCLDKLEIIVRKIFSGENLELFPSNP